MVTILASEFDVATSSRANCPLYYRTLHTFLSGTYVAYSGPTVALSGGDLEISTAEPTYNRTFYMKIQTKFSSSVVYFPISVRVVDCAQQYISLLEPTLTDTLAFHAKSTPSYTLEYAERFISHHDRCPITSIEITAVLHSETSEPLLNYTSIMAMGSASDDTMGTLTISNLSVMMDKHDIYIAAFNADRASSDQSISIVSLQLLPEINMAPFFSDDVPKTIKIEIEEKDFGSTYEEILPPVDDSNGDEVLIQVKGLQSTFMKLDAATPSLVFFNLQAQHIGTYSL